MTTNEDLREIMERIQSQLLAKINDSKEEVKKEIQSFGMRLDKMEKQNEEDRRELERIREENSDLNRRIEELEQYSRKNNIIISGIPKKEMEREEELMERVKEIAEKLKVKLETHDICALHRLPTRKKTEQPPVIVKLNSIIKKNNLMANAKEQRLRGIYINEHITQQTQILLNGARSLRDDGYIKFAWCKEGKVLIKCSEEDTTKRIRGMEELMRLKRSMEEKAENRTITGGGENAEKIKVNTEAGKSTARNGNEPENRMPQTRSQMNNLNRQRTIDSYANRRKK